MKTTNCGWNPLNLFVCWGPNSPMTLWDSIELRIWKCRCLKLKSQFLRLQSPCLIMFVAQILAWLDYAEVQLICVLLSWATHGYPRLHPTVEDLTSCIVTDPCRSHHVTKTPFQIFGWIRWIPHFPPGKCCCFRSHWNRNFKIPLF